MSKLIRPEFCHALPKTRGQINVLSQKQNTAIKVVEIHVQSAFIHTVGLLTRSIDDFIGNRTRPFLQVNVKNVLSISGSFDIRLERKLKETDHSGITHSMHSVYTLQSISTDN